MEKMRIYFKQLELGPLQNFVYLIGSLETREAAVVDPAWDVSRILQTAAQDEMRITMALVTHTHFDHINGVKELVELTDAKVILHRRETDNLPIQPSSIRAVEGGDQVSLGSLTVSFLHTPGSQCMTFADRLISGDTLFVGGCGRCDLPGGDPEALHRSLGRLSRLDERMVVHPGHHYAPEPDSTIRQERAYNPFLRAGSSEEFLSLVGRVKRRRPDG